MSLLPMPLPTYSIASIKSTDAADYKVVIGGKCGPEVSANVRLSIGDTNNGLIKFTDPALEANPTKNLCAGDAPLNLNDLVDIKNGTWTVTSQNKAGLSVSGSTAFYTPSADNYTETEPHILLYTVNQSSCIFTKNLTIYVKDNKTTPAINNVPNVICPNVGVTLNAFTNTPGDYTYLFIDKSTGNVLSDKNSYIFNIENNKNLTLKNINSYGCQSAGVDYSIKAVFGSGVIQADKTVINVGQYVQFTLDGATNSIFKWDFKDGGTAIWQNPKYYFYISGDFEVSVNIYNGAGCSKDLTTLIKVVGKEEDIVTKIQDNPEQSVSIYPNPVSGELNVTGHKNEVCEIRTLSGQRMEKNIVNNRIDVSDLATGVYVMLVDGKAVKFIKK